MSDIKNRNNSNNQTNINNSTDKKIYSFKATSMFEYTNSMMSKEVNEYLEDEHIKTGFDNWDSIIGHLKTGIYVLGATTSLGKTTFLYQVAEQLAKQGEDVLFFSYENSTFQLATKSLSRIMAMSDMSTAIPSNAIEGKFNDDKVKKSIDELNKYSERLMTIQCGFHTTIEEIAKYVTDYIFETGRKPIVFIDYLQLVQVENRNLSTKDRIDTVIGVLKQLQKDNKLILFIISSFNRQNYMSVVDFESFKESGGIEFTADVVLGLQLQTLHNPVFDEQGKMNEKRKIIQKAKKAIPRKIELVAIKNRLGACVYSCNFIYYPQFDLFIPDTEKDNVTDTYETDNNSIKISDLYNVTDETDVKQQANEPDQAVLSPEQSGFLVNYEGLIDTIDENTFDL